MKSASRAVLRVKKLTELAIVPTRGSTLAAGYDLASAYDAVIPAGGMGMVKTDLAIGIPDGCYARVAPRSGLALKKSIDTGAGVIDADYRGNVGVILFNHSKDDFQVKRGDRVAQLILEKIEYAEVREVTKLDETERGAGGYGSTGVDRPLKRMREPDEAVEIGPASTDAVVNALDNLSASGAIQDDKRALIKTRAFAASDRQYQLLSAAMEKYESDRDEKRALEWIEAFLKSTE